MAVPKSTQIRFVGIITSTIHQYTCFIFDYHAPIDVDSLWVFLALQVGEVPIILWLVRVDSQYIDYHVTGLFLHPISIIIATQKASVGIYSWCDYPFEYYLCIPTSSFNFITFDKLYNRTNLPPSLRTIMHFTLDHNYKCCLQSHQADKIKKLWPKGITMHVSVKPWLPTDLSYRPSAHRLSTTIFMRLYGKFTKVLRSSVYAWRLDQRF